MSDQTRPTCSTCPYWDGTSHSLTAQCRRHAPHRLINATNTWCMTGRGDFCGEHPSMAGYVATIREQDAGTRPTRPISG